MRRKIALPSIGVLYKLVKKVQTNIIKLKFLLLQRRTKQVIDLEVIATKKLV